MSLTPTQPKITARPRTEGEGIRTSGESSGKPQLPRSRVIFREDLSGDGGFSSDGIGDRVTGGYSPLQHI